MAAPNFMSRMKRAVTAFQSPEPTPPQYGKLKKLPSSEVDEFVGDLNTKIAAGIAAHAERKHEMMQADKFWLGEHWDDQAPPWMPKPVENWVFATVEQHSANLATANIVPIIFGQDPGDEDVASMFDKVMQYLWSPTVLNGRQIVRRSIHTALKLGTVLVKVYWDNTVNGGRWLRPDHSAVDFTNPLSNDGSTFPVTHTMYKGQVCWERVDPSNVIPDPGGYELKGPGACSWITIRTPRKLEWIGNNPMFQQYVGKAQLKTALEQLEQGNRGDTEFYYGRPINNNHNGVKDFMFDEIWIRRMDEYGNWHIDLVYKIGSVLLYYAEDVYRDGEFPFAVLYDYEVDKSFFGMGEPKQVIPNNNTINQINRLSALNAMHMTNTQKVVTTDSGIDPNYVATVGSMPGAVFISRTGKEGISNLEQGEIPSSVFKVAESAREGIRVIMAMDEANMGQFGGSVTAASGIKLIQDKANVRDQDKGYNVEDFVSRLVFLTLSRVQQFYTDERYIPIVGKEGKPIPGPDGKQQFFPFKGSDYQDLTLMVHVESGSGTPLNKGAIAQRAWEMFQKQAEQKFDPPLITAEELLDTFDGFPLKEQMKQRIKDANDGKMAQQAVQIAQVFQVLLQNGVDVSKLDPRTALAIVQQVQASGTMSPAPAEAGVTRETPEVQPG